MYSVQRGDGGGWGSKALALRPQGGLGTLLTQHEKGVLLTQHERGLVVVLAHFLSRAERPSCKAHVVGTCVHAVLACPAQLSEQLCDSGPCLTEPARRSHLRAHPTPAAQNMHLTSGVPAHRNPYSPVSYRANSCYCVLLGSCVTRVSGTPPVTDPSMLSCM